MLNFEKKTYIQLSIFLTISLHPHGEKKFTMEIQSVNYIFRVVGPLAITNFIQ